MGEQETAGKEASRETSHDEPIVVDNGPLRVNLGGKTGSGGHTPTTGDKKTWNRTHTGLGGLLLLEYAADGEIVNVESRGLKRSGVTGIEISLSTPAGPKTMTFDKRSGDTEITMTTPLVWNRDKDTGWLTQGDNVQITKLQLLKNGTPLGSPLVPTTAKRTFVIGGIAEG